MNDKKVSFLPYHALNEFMNSEYRLDVVRKTLNSLPTLPKRFQSPLNRMIKKVVSVPGFRNSSKAPTQMKVKPLEKAFTKSSELVAAILSAWSEAHAELRQQVYDLLKARDWEILHIDTDRTKLPGFLTKWPKDENFEILNNAFLEMYPDTQANSDDISLMVVWLSGRLPYQIEEDEEQTGETALTQL